jgi:phage terminase large subunit
MANNADLLFEVTDVYYANRYPTVQPPTMEDGSAAPVVLVNQGGTWSSKTISILQCLFTEGLENPGEFITVAGQDIPNLKVGALRDMQRIIANSPKAQRYIKSYNKSERIYTLTNGTVIEFNSYDSWQDAKSGKRDRLFVNEINFPGAKAIYRELAMRTAKKIYLDYNPNEEFWIHTDLLGEPGVQLIRSDHRHNTFLTDAQHNRIETIPDKELWKVYARGMTGKLEGLIFRNWDVVPEIPEGAKLIGTGMDFGFTNDPSTLIDVYIQSGELWLDERLYEYGLTNVPIEGVEVQPRNISGILYELGFTGGNHIVADSAEPKSIYELQMAGWAVIPAKKGPDSVRTGIDVLKRYKMHITRRSANLKKELSSYKWKVDRNGKTLNEPVDFNNHLLDPLRYVALDALGGDVAPGKYSVW